MNSAASKAIAVNHVLNSILIKDRGRLLAALIARLNDFQLAEDALQEAVFAALKHWSRTGPPDNPQAWLLKVGLNKGIDLIRKGQREQRKTDDLEEISVDYMEHDSPEAIPDERLRLIFSCCHPSLEEKSRVALTLRTVCGLTTKDIAKAFLDSEHTMGQRLYRAKAKIKTLGLRFAVPEPEMWQERLKAVLTSIYLIFTTGYLTEDEDSRVLSHEGIFLARLLNTLHPNAPEIEGLLALMLLTEARSNARIDTTGCLVTVEDQNSQRWRQDLVDEARHILSNAVRNAQPGPFQIKAAITDCHMTKPRPDWQQMSLLYQALWQFEPTPVVALNWAVVSAEIGLVDIALQKINELKNDLKHYQPWHATRAHIQTKLGMKAEAIMSFKLAIQMAPNAATRKFLQQRLNTLER
ncbi:sigma-70 family RNA polymerase sigma factor [Aestuariibacter sp. AA17]|uniref:Sigma-70 family RNA polymerase sigma factor n=1 Tax=Fluctibacter corallii TaxID=2984329 RepID=A0ABT3A699_9ALTE|nr:sigma-70 family RNA polymerase sigma factor [Aestuariibacter sp. AA17]MCV2884200.1 sigma-70 family RNA polymerase sigma factor [Aestuariibacter sp. AA17]